MTQIIACRNLLAYLYQIESPGGPSRLNIDKVLFEINICFITPSVTVLIKWAFQSKPTDPLVQTLKVEYGKPMEMCHSRNDGYD